MLPRKSKFKIQKLQLFCWRVWFCLFMELRCKGSAITGATPASLYSCEKLTYAHARNLILENTAVVRYLPSLSSLVQTRPPPHLKVYIHSQHRTDGSIEVDPLSLHLFCCFYPHSTPSYHPVLQNTVQGVPWAHKTYQLSEIFEKKRRFFIFFKSGQELPNFFLILE